MENSIMNTIIETIENLPTVFEPTLAEISIEPIVESEERDVREIEDRIRQFELGQQFSDEVEEDY